MKKGFERFLDERDMMASDSNRKTVRGKKNYNKNNLNGFMEVGTNPNIEFDADTYEDVLADDSGREVGSNMELEFPYELPKHIQGSNNNTANKILTGSYKIEYYIPERFFKDAVYYSNESILDDNRRYVVSVSIIELVTNAIINNLYNYIETYGKVNVIFNYHDSDYEQCHSDIINLLIFKLRSRGFNTNKWKIKGIIGLCIDDSVEISSKVKGLGKYLKNNILNSFDENIPLVPYDMKVICEEVPSARVCILVDKILDDFDCNIELRETMNMVYDNIRMIRSNNSLMYKIKLAYDSVEALLETLLSFWEISFTEDEMEMTDKKFHIEATAKKLNELGKPIYWDDGDISDTYVFTDYLRNQTQDFTYDPPKDPITKEDAGEMENLLVNMFNYITSKYFVYGEYISIVRIPDGWNYWKNY